MDRRSQRLFSTSTFQIGWQPNVTTTVSNGAIAPQSNGPWALQLNLYIFEEAGEVANFNHVFDIQVGNPVVNAQQTTSTGSATLATTATGQTSLPLENIPCDFQCVDWAWRTILHSRRPSGRRRSLCSTHSWDSKTCHLNVRSGPGFRNGIWGRSSCTVFGCSKF